MAYKRYVHKKGKRHGPYYYKNVRDESGKVRSIYLGKASARGKRPLEVAIVFLAVLLITISALFFIQNRNLVLSRIAVEESQVPFEVDQILIKVLVKADEYVEKELRVMNVGDEERSILVEVSGVSDIVNAIDNNFIIKPGQTKIVRLNFSSFNSAKGIEEAPGVHIGKILVKTGSYEKDVPIVVEIESKNVLFDMNLNPVARDRSVLQGASTTFEIRVFNLQSIESSNVDMEFFVKDTNGNTIISEKESVVVKTQASFFKTLKIPENLKTGNYVFAAKASFGNSIGIASYLFEVEEAAEEKRAAKFIGFCRNDPLCWSLSIVVLLLIFTVGAYAYFFIGAFIYKRLFGIRAPKPKKVRKTEAKALIAEGKKESSIAKFFRGWKIRKDRGRELRLKKKLEFEKQKLKLQEREEKLKEQRLREKEKEFEIKKRLEEKKREEKEESRGLAGKCRRIIDKGYKALDKNNLRKADNAYAKLMDAYINLPSERKIEVFKEINSFYKSLLLKKSQLRQKEEEGKKRELERKGHEELDAKRKEEEKIRKAKLREELRKERKKKVFELFHGLGLVKTKKEKRELGIQKQREKELKEIEKKKREEEKRKADEEAEKRKLEEERQKEIERAKKTEEEKIKREEEERQRQIEEKKKEEERRRIESEKKKQEELEEKRRLEEERQKEIEIKRREQERKRVELEEKKQKELEEKRRLEEERQRQFEIERKEEERRKKQEEKNRKLKEIEDLEKSIKEKDNKIEKSREKIRKTASEKDAMANEISKIEKDIEGLDNEKKMLLKVYNESAESRKKFTRDYESKLAEWKVRYDVKLREKNQLRAEVKIEYEGKIKELESELEGLSRKDRPEQEKWKRLELKAKYKLEESEREKAVTEELKILQMEKKEIENEFSRKKQGIGKDAVGKDVMQKQKEINDSIRAHERDIERLKKEIEDNEKALKRFSSSIKQLSEEKEKIKEKLRQKKKESGLGYITSFFKFEKKKKEPEKEGVKKEKPRIIKEKEVLEKKKALPEKKEEFKEKPKKGLFSRLFEKKEEAKKPEAEAKAGGKKEKRKEAEEELEESLKDLEKVFGQKKEKEALKEEINARREIERKREGKSRLFAKCHKLLLKAEEALQNNDASRAKKLYLKTRNLYIKLEYMEKKEIYNDLMALYNKLSK